MTTTKDQATPVARYTLVFTDYEETIEAESLQQLCLHVIEHYDDSNEPDTFITPDGNEYEWHAYAANAFAAKGRMNEKQFLNMLLSANKRR